MPCLLSLITLLLPVLSVSATVTLGLPTEAGVQVPTNVTWTRDAGDPRVFDLRYINSAGADVGFAVTVRADKGARSGSVPVVFPTEGQFMLKAIDFENGNKVIAESQPVEVGPTPPNPTEPSTTLVPTSDPPPATPTAPLTISTTPLTTSSSTPPSTESPRDPSSISPSSTPAPAFPPTGASSKPASKTPAIVGGIIGGLALVAVLILLAFLIKRRRDKARAQRRLTFHREFMVQHRPTPADLERGAVPSRSPVLPPLGFQQPTTVPTPRGPTKTQFSPSFTTIPVSEPTLAPTLTPTPRQMQLDGRIRQLEQQMMAIRRQNRGQAGMRPVLEQMRMQVEWLRDQRDSPWAKGETDVPPPHIDMYMA